MSSWSHEVHGSEAPPYPHTHLQDSHRIATFTRPPLYDKPAQFLVTTPTKYVQFLCTLHGLAFGVRLCRTGTGTDATVPPRAAPIALPRDSHAAPWSRAAPPAVGRHPSTSSLPRSARLMPSEVAGPVRPELHIYPAAHVTPRGRGEARRSQNSPNSERGPERFGFQ
ncbi:hypothetical protein EYF80_045903 [Liparis tanakae]|uniref:Uncharacterized protein n=1 Tax=Liparis tanakae TaxID=230148 RepID=A0A4Z2FSD0_9TELE|nr:hypothetical protein EYF80_045903 [Liparis tanakae]